MHPPDDELCGLSLLRYMCVRCPNVLGCAVVCWVQSAATRTLVAWHSTARVLPLLRGAHGCARGHGSVCLRALQPSTSSLRSYALPVLGVLVLPFACDSATALVPTLLCFAVRYTHVTAMLMGHAGTIHTAAAEIEAAGGRALAVQCDIRDEASVAAAVAATVERFGGIDVLVNNASAINLAGTADVSMKRYDLMHSINARGTFLVTKLCLPHLMEVQSAPVHGAFRWLGRRPHPSVARRGRIRMS